MSVRDLLTNEKLFNNIVNKAFKSVDTNNSGDIDFAEFEYLVRKIASEGDIEEPSSEEIKQIFQKLDLDNSGEIGLDEFKYLVLRILEMEG